MNIKITKEDHERLCNVHFAEHLFGSRLFGTNTEESDYDYIRVYSYSDVFDKDYMWLPNIHSFQFDDDGVQYIWMTQEQFWLGLSNGDGTMQADILLFGNVFDKDFALNMCSTYNVVKAYLGVARRDLKLHPKSDKKRFHAHRSIYMAQELLKGRLPNIEVIKELPDNLSDKEVLDVWCSEIRSELNNKYDKGEISRYYIPETEDTLLRKMFLANNIKEFKYK